MSAQENVQHYFGSYLIDGKRLNIQIKYLNYIPGKIIEIDSIYFKENHTHEKEYEFKHTINLEEADDLLSQIGHSLVSLIVFDLKLDPKRLKRLTVRQGKVFYLMVT